MKHGSKKWHILLSILLFSGFIMTMTLGIIGVDKISAQETNSSSSTSQVSTSNQNNSNSNNTAKGLGLLGAGIAFGLACLGAGIAAGNASSAAIGALSEKPSMFGTALIFIGVCEGFMIFGFVMALMIMGKL